MSQTATAPPPVPKRRLLEPLVAASGLLNVIVLAALAGVLVAIWILIAHHGWHYYTAPVADRGYVPEHAFLRPSGQGGHLAGIAGTLFLLGTLLYIARKKLKILKKRGSLMSWLEFHIFCGLFGPILITFHTSFKFNGIISVAYWSMALVVISGFVGRYLYVRIPKTIRGTELSQADIEERARDARARIDDAGLPSRLVERIDDTERALLDAHGFLGAFDVRRRTAALRGELRRHGVSPHIVAESVGLMNERAVLLRRIAHLKKTKAAFQSWHVFHRPLVWLMFVILSIHLGVAVYFGYTFFGR